MQDLRDRQIQSLKDKYRMHRLYPHVEKVIASLEHNLTKKTTKSVLCGLNEFFPEHKPFINELKAKLITLKVKL